MLINLKLLVLILLQDQKTMKYLILSLAAGFIIIGVHQTMYWTAELGTITDGISASYWLFMFALGMLFWYQHLKKKEKDVRKEGSTPVKEKPTTSTNTSTTSHKRKKPKKLKS